MPRTGPSLAHILATTVVVILLAALTLAVHACEIPVYHYALENWEPDPWEVFVFHRGELSASERRAVDLLRTAADHRQGHGNLIVKTVDLNTNRDAMMVQRWGEQGTSELPWVAAYYPQVHRIPDPAWSGPLKQADLTALVDSPLRQKIASELASRVTASWILLESGDRGKDNAVAALLERELSRLEDTLVLPVLEGWGPDGEANTPEDVDFTLHRLSRDSAEERMLVNMLLHSEPDLTTEFANEPLAFPIYGRGLILYALAGPGINEWTIAQAAEFLTGPCSCQVKASNPGTDLLVQLDWDSKVRHTARERMPPPSGMAGFQGRAEDAERRLAELGQESEPTTGGTTRTPTAERTTDRTARAPSSEPRASEPRTSSPSRSTASRPERGSRETPRVPELTDESDSPAEAASPSPDQTEAGEPLGPPDPDQASAQMEDDIDAAGEPDIDSDDLDDMFDDDAAATLTTNGDSDSGGGYAGLLAILGLIAAAITAAVTAIVLRSRQKGVSGEDHERIPT